MEQVVSSIGGDSRVFGTQIQYIHISKAMQSTCWHSSFEQRPLTFAVASSLQCTLMPVHTIKQSERDELS